MANLFASQKGKPYESQIINQFLKTATNGNVVAEFAVAAHRWRMLCKHCGVTLTMSEVYDIETEYVRNGRLDAGIQMFAKDHKHPPTPLFDPAGKTVTYNSLPMLGQGAAFTGPMLAEQQKAAEDKYQEYLKLKQAEEDKVQLQAQLNVQAIKAKQLETQKLQLAQLLKKFEYENPEGVIQNGALTPVKFPTWGDVFTPVPKPAPKPVPKPIPTEGRKFR